MAEVKVYRKGVASQKLKNLDAGIRSGMTKAGMYLVSVVHRVFAMFSPKGRASGKLLRSISVSRVVFVDGMYKNRIGPSVSYGWYLHQGTGRLAGHGPRKPPPTDAILAWIREKGLVPKTVTMKKTIGRITISKTTVRRAKRDIDREQRQLAFLIARKIGRDGTLPFPYMTAAAKVAKPDMEKIIIKEIISSLRR